MTMRTDTREATFVGDVKAHLVSAAQPGQAAPATPAFGRDSRHPVDVTADQLYVNDTDKTALFMGKVVAMQGDSTLKTPELHITYEGKAAVEQLTGAAPQQPGEGSRLSRLVAKNGSVVTIGTDRRVSSEQAEFDAKADTALFTGDVVVQPAEERAAGQAAVHRPQGRHQPSRDACGWRPAGRPHRRDVLPERQQRPARSRSRSLPPPITGAAAVQDGVMGSFKMDPNAPMDIEADTLDVYDAEKRAVFHGNVKSKQGEFVVRTVEMTPSTTGQAGLGLSSGGDDASKTPSQLTRVEAKQKVLITSKDGQTATGDWAIFDIKANTVLLGDDVTISRGKDVAQGPRLKIDLTTGMYRFELEQEPARGATGPATSASPPLTAPPRSRPIPPAAYVRPASNACWSIPRRLRKGPRARSRRLLPGARPPSRPTAGSRAPAPARRSGATDAMRLFPFKAKKRDAEAEGDRRGPTGTRRSGTAEPRRAERALRRAGVAHGRQRAEVLPQQRWWSRASASRPAAARPSGCWAPTAPARPPCSTWSPAWCRPMPARSRSTAAT